MQSLIDIMGAIFIGGILILVAMTAMDSGLQAFVNSNADAIVQNELATLSRIIQYDLRKMGYGVPEADKHSIIQTGTSTTLKFLSHLNLDSPYSGSGGTDSTPDTITYSLGVAETYNFIDTSVVLYAVNRKVVVPGVYNRTVQVGSITNVDIFRYLDQAGNELADPSYAQMVEVTFVALNPEIYLNEEVLLAADPVTRMTEIRNLMRESFWRQTRVISKNLRR